MNIFVHCYKNSESFIDKVKGCPSLYLFSEFQEIENRLSFPNEVVKNLIFCAEDPILVKQLSQYDHILIISERVLHVVIIELKQIYMKQLLFSFLEGVVLKFSDFPEDDKIMILKTKAIIMGAKLTNCISDLTHVIPYRMSGSLILMILGLHKHIKIFNKFFIEYYWTNCMTIQSPYKCPNNSIIESIFRGRLFMNCHIILLGFDKNSMMPMIKTITSNGGSVINMNSVNESSHIIYPFKYLSNPNLLKEFKSIPPPLYKNIINDNWFHLSVTTGCLSSMDNYQFVNTTNVPFWKEIHSDDVPEEFNDIDNNDVSIVQIERSHISYDPRKKSTEDIKELDAIRLNQVKEFIYYFKDKKYFFNELIAFLRSLLMEYRDLQILIEDFSEILNFYEIMDDIFDPIIDNIDDDTFVGMLSYAAYTTSVAEYHKKFIIDFEKIEAQLKKAMKENAFVKEKLEAYLHRINYSVNGLVNRPMLLLPRIKLIIEEIMKNSSYLHPDIKYLQSMVDKTVEVLDYHSSLVTLNIENNKQAKISTCINQGICSGSSKFVSVIDCMSIDVDGLRTAMSLFLFTDKILLSKVCNQAVSHKRFSRIIKHLKFQNDDNFSLSDGFNESMSRYSSVQSLYSSPSINSRANRKFARKDSTKSTSSNIEKLPFDSREATKFSKLFSGLTMLKLWGSNIPVIYESTTVYQSKLFKSISHIDDGTLDSQLLITLQVASENNDDIKQLKLFLVPILVKDFSEYEKIDTIFENDLPWDASGASKVTWSEFIMEEKLKFCELVSRLFSISLIDEEPSVMLKRSQYGSQLSVASNSSFNFATPLHNSKATSHSTKNRSGTPDIFKNISDKIISSVKSIRKSLCPSSRSEYTHPFVARSSNDTRLLTSEPILESSFDFESNEDVSRKSSFISKLVDKENVRLPDQMFLTPQTKRSSKRKSHDIGTSEKKNPRY